MLLNKLLLATLIAIPMQSFADDFGTWCSTEVKKKISKTSIEVEVDWRFNGLLESDSRRTIGLSITQNLNPYFKIQAGYQYIDKKRTEIAKPHYNKQGNFNGYNIEESEWRTKNRLSIGFTGELPIGRWTLSLRERYQPSFISSCNVGRRKYRIAAAGSGTTEDTYNKIPFSEYDIDHKKSHTDHNLRTRIEIDYNIRHCKVDPYASYEIFSALNNTFATAKHRFIAGGKWKLSKQHNLTAEYVLTHECGEEFLPSRLHAIRIGYSFKF